MLPKAEVSGEWGVLFDGHRVCSWKDKVLEMDGGKGCITV